MSIIDKFMNSVTNAISGSTGNGYNVCAYACPDTEWNPQPWTSSPDMIINPEQPKEEIMNIEYYKKKFAELFMEMERQHGYCKMLHIEHGEEVRRDDGSIMSARVDVKIEF